MSVSIQIPECNQNVPFPSSPNLLRSPRTSAVKNQTHFNSGAVKNRKLVDTCYGGSIVPTFSSLGVPDIERSFPVLFHAYEGPGIVFTSDSPQVPSHQYGGLHGSQRVSSTWRFGPIVWTCTRESGWVFGQYSLYVLGKVFRRQYSLERAWLKTRGTQAGHFMTIFGCASC